MTMNMLLCLRIRSRPVKSMYSYLLFSRNMIQIKDVKVKSRKTSRMHKPTSQIATLRRNLLQVRAPRRKVANFQMFLQVMHTVMGNHKFLDMLFHHTLFTHRISRKRWQPKHPKILAQTSTQWLLTTDLHGTTSWSNQTPKTTTISQNS